MLTTLNLDLKKKNNDCVVRSLHEDSQGQGSKSFQSGEHVEIGKMVHSEQAWELQTFSPYLALCPYLFHLAVAKFFPSFVMKINKLVSKVFF